MNFYKRFIGDIQAKTGDLSLCEFGAYDRLLDHYYSTEKPIPAAKEKCYRICRAMSKDERNAVDKVLDQFFSLTVDGHIQNKAEEMIAKAQPLIEAARANGKLGGRPRKETQKKPSRLLDETQREPGSKASQSQSHSPSLRSVEVGAEAMPGIPPELFADFMAVRKDKKAKTFTATAAKGLIREAEKAGVTLQRAVEACCEYGWIGFNPKWYAERQQSARPAETVYQQSQRARVAELAPGVVKRHEFIEMEPPNVIVLAGR